jgi:AcrR family transcriptional regulator
MRTHGWRGDPPRSDDEARARIIEAAGRCVDRFGARKTGLTDIAQDLGVTRATVYRYFTNAEDLLKATSLAAAAEFLERLTAHCAQQEDPADMLVEAIAFTAERLPHEPRIGVLIKAGRIATLEADLLSPTTRSLARGLLEGLPVDWRALGYAGPDLDGLVECLLRLLHSFLQDTASGHSEVDPRPFLRRWFVPGFRAASAGPRTACVPSVDLGHPPGLR